MKYKIIPTDEFLKNLKKLAKKNKNIKKDILDLIDILENNPKEGVYLGNNTYKIRLKNSNNNKGKSGGYRIITYLIDENFEIYLITIYSKSNRESILDDEIKKLIKNLI